MTTTNRPLADVPTAVLRATTRELVAELVRRIDAGELDAEDVCRRLNVSSMDDMDELCSQLGIEGTDGTG